MESLTGEYIVIITNRNNSQNYWIMTQVLINWNYPLKQKRKQTRAFSYWCWRWKMEERYLRHTQVGKLFFITCLGNDEKWNDRCVSAQREPILGHLIKTVQLWSISKTETLTASLLVENSEDVDINCQKCSSCTLAPQIEMNCL